MIKLKCSACGSAIFKSPSKVHKRNYCSIECYKVTLIKELTERGKASRFGEGHKKNSPEHYKKLAALLKDSGHPKWKGEKVSYRGLHQWVRRNKGKPTKCIHCGFSSVKPKLVQWANIDGEYRRNLDDFISLCASCHKRYDIKLQSIRDEKSASQ